MYIYIYIHTYIHIHMYVSKRMCTASRKGAERKRMHGVEMPCLLVT